MYGDGVRFADGYEERDAHGDEVGDGSAGWVRVSGSGCPEAERRGDGQGGDRHDEGRGDERRWDGSGGDRRVEGRGDERGDWSREG